MTLEDTLADLQARRTTYKAYRAGVEAELRQIRQEKLSAELASIEHLVVRAMAEGATLGQVKRAYGTKDHRTISTIVSARASEIDALKAGQAPAGKPKAGWFTILDNSVRLREGSSQALFTWHEVDGKLMFLTEEPLWNEDFTIKNEAVALLDGKAEDSCEEARLIAEEIRKRG